MCMSQGYLNTSSTNEEDMERVGEDYFQTLLTRSFFQDRSIDVIKLQSHSQRYFPNTSTYKMHDIVHKFAQLLSNDESLFIDMKSSSSVLQFSTQLLHLTVLNARNVAEKVISSAFRSKQQSLHTLRIPKGSIKNSLENLSQYLCLIEALDLSFNGMEAVPKEVGQFVHLRYLNLSGNPKLKSLPETIYELCYLQTLLLEGCKELKELPKEGIEKLENLRELEIHDEMVLPKGIGSVISIRTLGSFVCRDEGAAGATIGDLEKLNNLQGSLELRRLKNVKDGREASKAKLGDKNRLVNLFLDFGGGKPDIEEEVIAALEPPSHSLETLSISSYSGKVLPTWSLSKLRELHLTGCKNCEVLSLGELPCLETLHIFNGTKMTTMTTTSSSAAVAFPKLKELKICACPELELPTQFISPLTTCLEILDCPILGKRCWLETGEDWCKISHILHIKVEFTDDRRTVQFEIKIVKKQDEEMKEASEENRDEEMVEA